MNRFVKIKATIYYMVDADHPDYQYIKEPKAQQQFSDTYTFDTLYWGNDFGSMEARMKHGSSDEARFSISCWWRL